MTSSSHELKLAFFAVVGISAVYITVLGFLGSIPSAGELFGHSIGILGFLLMVMTETLYSLRKRSRNSRWGRMATWLQFHIFTGIVGPYMVLLHSSWKFNGVAGIVTWLTALIVGSGFIGRYIYTAVPRTADGAEIESSELERQINYAEIELHNWLSSRQNTVLIGSQMMPVSETVTQVESGSNHGSASLIFGRGLVDWRFRWQWWLNKQKMDPQARQQADTLERLVRKRDLLRRQLGSLAMARRLLGIWHAVHIPVGLALFALSVVHIIAAIYYGLLLG